MIGPATNLEQAIVVEDQEAKNFSFSSAQWIATDLQ